MSDVTEIPERPERTFDPKCLELAQHFLPDGSAYQQRELAEMIQNSIENYLYLEAEKGSS